MCALDFPLAQLYILDVLLFVAVVTANGATELVNNGEVSAHRLVVGDALRIVASDDATKLVRSLNGLLLNNLKVFDDAEHYLWSNN